LAKTNILKNSNTPGEITAFPECPVLLEPEDLANGILYVLSTPYTVNITELTIRAIGDRI
jgi:NADP-dependent 3-hydroxy acid dehydrogenase YdfG